MTGQPASIIKPRVAPINRGAGWLFDGFGYFQKNYLPWIGAVLLLFVITFALGLVPILGGLAVQLLMPVFIAGLILGCHAQAQGSDFTVKHLFAGFSKNTSQLIILGALYLVGMLVIVILMVVAIFILPGGNTVLENIESGNTDLIMQSFKIFLSLMLIGLALYMPLLMAFWFAPALVVLNDVTPMQAIQLSFMGCLVNILPFTLYGLLALVFSILAVLPLLLGLLILLPMITASIYVAWREIYL